MPWRDTPAVSFNQFLLKTPNFLAPPRLGPAPPRRTHFHGRAPFLRRDHTNFHLTAPPPPWLTPPSPLRPTNLPSLLGSAPPDRRAPPRRTTLDRRSPLLCRVRPDLFPPHRQTPSLFRPADHFPPLGSAPPGRARFYRRCALFGGNHAHFHLSASARFAVARRRGKNPQGEKSEALGCGPV